MKIFYFILALLICAPTYAQYKEYNHLYEYNLDEEIPPLYRLEREYKKSYSNYRWNYDFRWNMSSFFNSEFKQNITLFGTSEKRLANADEDAILRQLKKIPKPFYQYIGPLIHTMRGLSGKVLDLPGIKETKHQFPTHIASRFKDVPYIELTSPHLYMYLNPVLWGEDMASIETPQIAKQPRKKRPRVRINPEFMQRIKAKVRAIDYADKGRRKTVAELDLRHFNPDRNTPLSKADVRAFARTLDGLDNFRKEGEHEKTLIMVESLMNYWDVKNGIPEESLLFRQIVNPCQNFVRKIQWSGLQGEFQTVIGQQGFGLKDWAYTCDKVVKAWRVHNAPSGMIWAARQQKKGAVYPLFEPFLVTEQEKTQMHYILDSLARMYTTKAEDIDAIKPYNTNLKYQFIKMGRHLAGTPIIRQ